MKLFVHTEPDWNGGFGSPSYVYIAAARNPDEAAQYIAKHIWHDEMELDPELQYNSVLERVRAGGLQSVDIKSGMVYAS
jgi:hypothetical protein